MLDFVQRDYVIDFQAGFGDLIAERTGYRDYEVFDVLCYEGASNNHYVLVDKDTIIDFREDCAADAGEDYKNVKIYDCILNMMANEEIPNQFVLLMWW